ncbi:putative glycolipid-binding domain-containing protein [Actinomadura sp. 9N215]|uniref:putative glycolipid-binding domain-containing protein n=1 Tax=Actinomadura sp. 9N215 TaxID=3375150 RepID=UPI0037B5617E
MGGRPLALDEAPDGRWPIHDRHDPRLNGCVDVNLESSAMTNALPVHRLHLNVDETADAPAVYVRAADLTVDRLEQSYARLPDTAGRQSYAYATATPGQGLDRHRVRTKAGPGGHARDVSGQARPGRQHTPWTPTPRHPPGCWSSPSSPGSSCSCCPSSPAPVRRHASRSRSRGLAEAPQTALSSPGGVTGQRGDTAGLGSRQAWSERRTSSDGRLSATRHPSAPATSAPPA